MLKVTFLGSGTSQGVPLIGCHCEVCSSTDPRDNRLRSSVLVESETTRIVIDTGPDFRQQMLREHIEELDGVIFTHEHKDHIAGLDEIRAFNFISNKKMPIYASVRVQEALKREFAYVFSEIKYPGIPQVEMHTIGEEPFVIGDLTIHPIDVIHYQLPVKGFRIGQFCYITDANMIPPAQTEKIRGCRVLVLNALRRETHISHFTLEEAVAMSSDLNVEKTFLTHISHQMGLHREVSLELPHNVELACDGLQLVL